jgi:hypothetical protein
MFNAHKQLGQLTMVQRRLSNMTIYSNDCGMQLHKQ